MIITVLYKVGYHIVHKFIFKALVSSYSSTYRWFLCVAIPVKMAVVIIILVVTG